MAVTQVTREQMAAHIIEDDPERRINALVLHHTWSPTAAQYRGLVTVESIRRYHMAQRGWRDIGYNVILGPGGDLFIGRTLRSGGGAHTKEQGMNSCSVGLSMIADFDSEDWREQTPVIEAAVRVAGAYCRRFDIPMDRLFYHRDFAPKSCPGSAFMERTEWRRRVALAVAGEGEADAAPLRLIVNVAGGDHVVPSEVREGRMWAPVRDLAETGIVRLVDHSADQRKVYLFVP